MSYFKAADLIPARYPVLGDHFRAWCLKNNEDADALIPRFRAWWASMPTHIHRHSACTSHSWTEWVVLLSYSGY